MGLLGFLDFVLKCIQLLAWPSFALGYPLCASIRAIETNSNFYMRKLVAYWILFSLISLFEYTFSKLLEWVPVWSYVKILAICWLVIPHFNGASIAYNNFVRPCLSMQLPQIIVDLLNKKHDLSLKEESFLVVAERYVKENGTEALEKLIASKPKINETPVAEKDIKAVEILDKSVPAAENKPKINEPPVARKDIKAVEILDKSLPAAENKPKINEPPVAQKDIEAVEILDKSVPAAENKITTTMDANIKVNNTTLPEKLTENVFVVPPAFKNVQKEWTCAVCQVTTQSEATLNSHLQGMKHRTKCEELKGKHTATRKGVPIGGPNKERSCAISQVTTHSETMRTSLHRESVAGTQTAKKNNSSSTAIKSDQPNQDLKKVSTGIGPKKFGCANQDPKKSSSGCGQNNRFGCNICQVTLQSEATLKSHLQGTRHRSNFEQLKARETTEKDKITLPAKDSDKNISGRNKNYSTIAEVKIEANVSNGYHSCSICNVTCTSESDMASHLRGKRHLSQIKDSVPTSVVHYWCNICDLKCKSEIDIASHLNGKTHDSNLYDSD